MVQPIRLPSPNFQVAGQGGYVVGWTPIDVTNSTVTVYALMHANVTNVPAAGTLKLNKFPGCKI